MASLCYRTDFASTEGDSPAALGNRIAAAVLEYGRTDGAHEDERYKDPAYTPVNEPLEVAKPGTAMKDPNNWQPLALAEQISQNGIPIPGQVQSVHRAPLGTRHARSPSHRPRRARPIDPGRRHSSATRPPTRHSRTRRSTIIRRSQPARCHRRRDHRHRRRARSATTRWAPTTATGYDVNPATGQPYEPHVVLHGRLRAGPGGVLGRRPEVGDAARPLERDRQRGLGHARRSSSGSAARASPVDRLEWDVKLYLALNGAIHDAAIAAWGVKGFYDSARPISHDPVHGRARASRATRTGPRTIRRACRSCPASSRSSPRPRAPPGERHAAPGPRRGDRHQRLARLPGGSRNGDQRRRLDPRRRLGALPAQHVRDPAVRRLPVRPQHVQPGRGRGHDRLHRRRVLPGRPVRVDDPEGRAEARGRPDGGHRRSSGRPTSTRPTRPVSRDCSWASICPATTSRAARSVRPAARTRWPWRSATSTGPPCPEARPEPVGGEDPFDDTQVGDRILGGTGVGPPSSTAVAKARPRPRRDRPSRTHDLGVRRDGRIAAGCQEDLRRPIGRDVERDPIEMRPWCRRCGPAGRSPSASSR